MTHDLFPKPPADRLLSRRISANALCGPSCPELEWTGMAKPAPTCRLFESKLEVDYARAVRCRGCIQETGQ
jgi:hypothetical protein